jgi:hypothetical protein
MKQIILAWLNANGTNEQKSLEIEYQCEKFAIGFGEYLDSLTYQDMGELTIKELLEIYKKEKGL